MLGELNLIVWKWVVGVSGFCVFTAYLVMLGIAFEASFSQLYGPYAATAKQAAKIMSYEFSGYLTNWALFLYLFG